MKKSCVALGFTLALVICFTPTAAQAPVTLRLGTLAPDGTIFSKLLKELGADWQKVSEGRVRLVVTPGGSRGDEPTMLRMMRASGQLQAGALSGIALSSIDPAFNVFAIPMFYSSYEEVFHLMDKLAPTFKDRLEREGFVFVQWGYAGWVQVFSKKPVKTVKDLRALKIFTSAGDDRMVQWYKDNGFQPVPLAPTDMMTALNTGMVDVVPMTPLAALSFQWYKQTPYMLEVGLAPLIGATLVTRKAWEQVPDADRAKLLDAAARLEKRLRAEVPKSDESSVVEMQKRGLTVTKLDGATQAEWRSVAQEFARSMRTKLVPDEIFDLALRERDAVRKP